MITRLAAIAVFAFALVGARAASADRMPAPKSNVCNHTKRAILVAGATYDRYSGWMTNGWTQIARGTCAVLQHDALHVQGKHTLTGVSKKHTVSACVLHKRSFRLTLRRKTAAADCTANKGKMVVFRYALYARKTKLSPVRVVK